MESKWTYDQMAGYTNGVRSRSVPMSRGRISARLLVVCLVRSSSQCVSRCMELMSPTMQSPALSRIELLRLASCRAEPKGDGIPSA